MLICPVCNTPQEQHFRFCKKCGAEIQELSVVRSQGPPERAEKTSSDDSAVLACWHCERPVQADNLFCEYCGSDIAKRRRAMTRRFGWLEAVWCGLAVVLVGCWFLWNQFGFKLILVGIPPNGEVLVDGKVRRADISSDGAARVRLSRRYHIVTVRAPNMESWSSWIRPWGVEVKREVRVSLYPSLDCADLRVPPGFQVAQFVSGETLYQPVIRGEEQGLKLCGPVGGKAVALLAPDDGNGFVDERWLVAEVELGPEKTKEVHVRPIKIRPDAPTAALPLPGSNSSPSQ
jgi:hypothetical protein